MATQDFFPVPADFTAASTADFTDLWRCDRNLDRARASASYSGTVPAASPYAVYLGTWVDQTLPTVTVGGVSRVVVEGDSPASGQVGIDRLDGRVIFHSSDASGAAVVTGRLARNVVPGEFLVRVQANIADLKSDIDALPTFETTSTDNAIVRFDGTEGDTQNSAVTIGDTGDITTPGDLVLSANSQTQKIEADDAATNSRVYTLPGNAVNTGGFIPWSTHRWSGTSAQPNWWLGDAGNSTLTGVGNYGFGKRSLQNLTTGYLNVAVGEDNLASVTTGIANTAIGESNGMWITTGIDNIAIGSDALGGDEEGTGLTTGSQNIGIGNNAGNVRDTEGGTISAWFGDNNIAIGRRASFGYLDEMPTYNSPYQRVIIAPLDGVAQADNSITLGRPAAEDAIYLMGETILPNNSATHTLQLGADVELFRSAANTLSLGSGDSLIVGNALTVNGNTTLGNSAAGQSTLRGTVTLTDSASGNPLNFGADVELYRSAANTLSTGAGDSMRIQGQLELTEPGTSASSLIGSFSGSSQTYVFTLDQATGIISRVDFRQASGDAGFVFGLRGGGDSFFTTSIRNDTNGAAPTLASDNSKDIYIDPSGGNLVVDGNVIPQTDNARDLGSASFRWDDVYATNGTIQTSDGRLKTVAETPVPSVAFLQSLRPVAYRWKDGKDTEVKHYGLIAQEVESSLAHAGEVGTALVNTEGEYLGMRYTELIPPLIQAIQDLQKQIDDLKEKLNHGRA